GCISVTANVAPEACSRLQAALEIGDIASAREIEATLSELHAALFCSPSPGPAKYALSKLDLCRPDTRLPILEPGPSEKKRIDAAMIKAGLH
ncbi:MAG: dihydrodipicolinate synthase family protein, partial [Pseudomonadota bacterium]